MSTAATIETEVLPPANGDHLTLVSPDVPQDIASIVDQNFSPFANQIATWRVRALAIRITDASQVREMKLARETRLALKDIRVNSKHVKIKLKEDINLRGRA